MSIYPSLIVGLFAIIIAGITCLWFKDIPRLN
jgi:hypothetical protein